MIDKVLTTKEVGNYLKVSTATLHRWEKSGKLIPDKKASRGDRFYLESSLKKFIASLPEDNGINLSIEMLPNN